MRHAAEGAGAVDSTDSRPTLARRRLAAWRGIALALIVLDSGGGTAAHLRQADPPR